MPVSLSIWRMRGLVQRVQGASVTVAGEVAGEVVGAIGPGLCVLVGVTHTDTVTEARKLAEKVWHLRVMDDEAGVMNRSVADTTREVLVVSQFTLYGDCRKGNRPSFNQAGKPEFASEMCDRFCVLLGAELGRPVPTGRFGAHMMVHLVNDGPVTLMLEREAG